MNQNKLEKTLAPYPFEKMAYFARVGSTNDVVAQWAEEGQRGLCLAVADEQTKGRGRAGRSWHTPPGSALAFSLLLPTDKAPGPASLGRANGLGALAVCEAIEGLFGAKAEIKWPNDVLLDQKKVCGVLAEARWQGETLQSLILGIGINIARSSLPPESTLNFPATSLETALEQRVNRVKVLKAVVGRLVERWQRLESPEFLQAWEDRLAFRNERVQLSGGEGGLLEGQVLGLGEDGRLRLKLNSGEAREFLIGEIQLRPVVEPG